MKYSSKTFILRPNYPQRVCVNILIIEGVNANMFFKILNLILLEEKITLMTLQDKMILVTTHKMLSLNIYY